MLEPVYALQRRLKRLRKSRNPRGMVLMYHRVAPLSVDPWDLNVTPEFFDQQIGLLKQHTHPMSLVDLSKALASGSVPERFSVVTFDDGYYNNLQYAKPILERHNVPATVFVTTGYTGSSREFWWDALESAVLLPDKLPPHLKLELSGQLHEWDLGRAAEPYQWNALDHPNDPARDARLEFYHSLWRSMQKMPDEARWRAIEQVQQWSGWTAGTRETHRPMNDAELRELIDSGVVAVGGHTVTHPFLPGLSIDQQRSEIEQGKQQLEAFIDQRVKTFSYPFNCHTLATQRLAHAAGFTVACTGREETVWRKSDPFQLTRFSAEQCDGAAFERRLQQWMR